MSKPSPGMCEVCKKVFTRDSASNIIHHILIHTGERPYTCQKCKRTYSSITYYRKHVSRSKRHNCEICARPFQHIPKLIQHMAMHTGEAPYKCEKCGQPFTHKLGYVKHMQYRKCEKHPQHTCQVCSKVFCSIGNLKAHQIVHTDTRPYRCELCLKGLRSKQAYRNHYSKCSDSSGDTRIRAVIKKRNVQDRRYSCEICSKTYVHYRRLIDHMTYHTEERTYSCAWCKKTFLTKCLFRKHCQNAHSALFCKLCPESFLSKVELDKHQLTHWHWCTSCARFFQTKTDYEQHLCELHMERFHS